MTLSCDPDYFVKKVFYAGKVKASDLYELYEGMTFNSTYVR